MNDPEARSTIVLNAAQIAVLKWIKAGSPDGVYLDGDFGHRISARTLQSRGLVQISGHGAQWRAQLTDRGKAWPAAVPADIEARELQTQAKSRGPATSAEPQVTLHAEPDERAGATVKAMRRISKPKPAKPRKIPTRQVSKQETYMKYKVVVTRVQVAERWVRATDEEHAAQKVQEEFERPYGYFGAWKTTASEVEIVEAEQTTVIRPNLLSETGPMLLSLKDAGAALGIPYSAVYELTNRGELEHTRIGSRKYVSRESLMNFIKENTHRGYYAG
ncbi:excisionase family DNA binding protein [Leucobacter komagatae]|uniref:Excisionase family DNA binding protein n=1 Tax=Leucobacter komagatae TaxID=55969 RepID=A0A542Y9K9_9MICO|nr:helix-turn-helix domain-containing protein [Leucobacter komagatae]TQL44772.1 excisionase family DNA binding protein [Leucobacter komagatae]